MQTCSRVAHARAHVHARPQFFFGASTCTQRPVSDADEFQVSLEGKWSVQRRGKQTEKGKKFM